MRARSLRRLAMICRWARGSASMQRLGRLLGIQGREHRLLLLAGEFLQGVGQVLAGQFLDLLARDRERRRVSVATASSSDSGWTYCQEMSWSLHQAQPAQAPFAQEAVERDVHVDDDHPALGLQQVDVVDHLGPPAVHVEDGLAHQVLVEQDPAGLVDEGRVRLAAFGRLDEDGVVLDLRPPCPRG